MRLPLATAAAGITLEIETAFGVVLRSTASKYPFTGGVLHNYMLTNTQTGIHSLSVAAAGALQSEAQTLL